MVWFLKMTFCFFWEQILQAVVNLWMMLWDYFSLKSFGSCVAVHVIIINSLKYKDNLKDDSPDIKSNFFHDHVTPQKKNAIKNLS